MFIQQAEFMVWHGQQHVHIKHHQANNKTKHNRWNPWAELGFKHNSKIIIFMKAEKIKMLRTQS